MQSLPKFNISSYEALLNELADIGSNFRLISEIDQANKGDVFIRHDLDFSVELAVPMAKAEKKMGISSTYYILLSGLYNPFSKNSLNAILNILESGHEIGLHYDLSLYPVEKKAALNRLSVEINFLEEILGSKINSIVMHEPYKGGVDLFEDNDLYINPMFFFKKNEKMMYVSDSCRAWRDESLLHYLNGDSSFEQLMLNIHPESWLSNKSQHRLTYLEETLVPKILEPIENYYKNIVKSVWQTHSAPLNGFGDSDEV